MNSATTAPSPTSLPLSSPEPKRLRLTIRAHTGQKEYVAATAPIVAAIAGTGGGKTVIGIIDLIMEMVKNPGQLWLVAEPTWPMVTRILLTASPGRPSLISLIKKFDPKAIYSKGDSAIYSTLGTILLASALNPQSMEGVHVAGVWLDEAGQMSKLAFETAKRRVAFQGGRVKLTTTPYNRGWLFKEVHVPAREGDPDIKVINFPSTSNPAYDRAAFERARHTMTDARFRMLHLGGFERPEGMIYGKQWDDRLIIDPFDIHDDWWQGAAMDFGWNHPVGVVWMARNPDGVYFLTHEYKRGETLLENHFKAIQKIQANGGPNPTVWYGDPAAKQERREMRNYGLPMRTADNTFLTGIDTMAELMATGRFYVFKTCTHWIDEIEGYVWDTKNDEFTDKPVKMNDDLMDAGRYLVHTEEKRGKPKLYT